ncbi:MAG: hypothetical protein ACK4KW_13125 [Gemmobacter sp.]
MSHAPLSASDRRDLEQALDALEAEFGSMSEFMPGADEDPAMAALTEALDGSGIEIEQADFSTMGLGQDPAMDAFFFNWIKNRVRKLLQQLAQLAIRYKACTACVAMVARAVAQFKAGNFPGALATALAAVACFRKCAKN